ncbi:hypothetical protein WUBG_15052 [Wuchereria bancrofti]|uniref:Uncharacterized protein n=1 Tax=Wuchereria bancrofti TaxID=6293 RepID=J9EF72_WUCBA|nr:hypothetical protein WUBG_15052 [Wuchereria bancrofti]
MNIMQHGLDPDKDELTTEQIFVSDPLLGHIALYKGKERDRVLKVCGWPGFGDIAQLDAFIDKNFMERRTQSRAVAAALITANSPKMEKILNLMLEKGKESNDEGLLEMEAFQEALQYYQGSPEQWYLVHVHQLIKFPGVMNIMQHGLDPDKDELTTEQIFVSDPLLGHIAVSPLLHTLPLIDVISL